MTTRGVGARRPGVEHRLVDELSWRSRPTAVDLDGSVCETRRGQHESSRRV